MNAGYSWENQRTQWDMFSSNPWSRLPEDRSNIMEHLWEQIRVANKLQKDQQKHIIPITIKLTIEYRVHSCIFI
jgi:hypothetical protein